MSRILLVEDHELLRSVLCEAIVQAGHEAEGVRTKADGAAALAANSYALLICSVRLPDGSGHDLLGLATSRGVKTVLMTGHPDEATALKVIGVAHLLRCSPALHLASALRRSAVMRSPMRGQTGAQRGRL